MDYQLEEGISHEVSGLHMEHPQQGKHPEGVDQVRQGFRRVVDLNHPPHIDLVCLGSLQTVRGFYVPLAPAGGHKNPQKGGIKGHKKRIGFLGRNGDEEFGQPV